MALAATPHHPPDGQGSPNVSLEAVCSKRAQPSHPGRGAYDGAMLQALQIADALAIAEASRRRSRDERAMVDYLGIGRRAPRAAEAPPPPPFLITDTIDLAAFESDERRSLEQKIEALSPEARRELIALTWLAQRPSLDFAGAMRRTRRIPPPAQANYLMGLRLERYIARGLEKLGYRPV